ncbi:hypothetical protein AKJ49_00340 [candidate division MSBL1 archaeon SCGC-AAA382A03]|uniref:Piwi domain-containing protein n=1 Tax=candidate division MSBL1 archaeon SCGC-AAA382A03 TaxID=1698278 RepID=A0A133VGV7_9EURY|nr:hypothetical protein AKJ49_00340 [candidate division MSBL1 archaeon SCGC-AAA382A03]
MTIGRIIQGCNFKEPELSFDYQDDTQVAKDPMSGLGLRRDVKGLGPYDQDVRTLQDIKVAVVYPDDMENIERIQNFLKSNINPYPGFEKVFKLPINFKEISMGVSFAELKNEDVDYNEIKDNIQRDILSENFDVALVVIPYTPKSKKWTPYYRLKAKLIQSFGLPSQMITYSTLRKRKKYLKWDLINLALGIYCKAGGKPWALKREESEFVESKCILGVRSSQKIPSRIGDKPRYVGFITLFEKEGAMFYVRGLPSFADWKKYVSKLEEEVSLMVEEYIKERSTPRALSIHMAKRVSEEEEESVQNALSDYEEIDYALARITEDLPFRIFDTDEKNYCVERGSCIQLSSKTSLLATTGKVGKYRGIGTPKPLQVSLASKREDSNFDPMSISRQVFRLTATHWRGINKNIRLPITLDYSQEMARLVSSMFSEEWEETMEERFNEISDTAWFI